LHKIKSAYLLWLSFIQHLPANQRHTLGREIKGLDNKKYIALSMPLEEIGRMAGGWYGQLVKQNSSGKMPEEK
jgi:hypothetical protein